LLSFYDHIHILSCIIFIDDSLPVGPLIAIIIIVVIIVFIVIDVTCYFKRKCGVFMCIKERVGRTGSMETRSKEKIIEEGDADG